MEYASTQLLKISSPHKLQIEKALKRRDLQTFKDFSSSPAKLSPEGSWRNDKEDLLFAHKKLRFYSFFSVNHLVSDYFVDILLKIKVWIFTDEVEINRYANETKQPSVSTIAKSARSLAL